MRTITFPRLKTSLSVILFLIIFSAFSQTQKKEIQSSNNSYNLSDNLWNSYVNKGALLLEKVDVQSFFNYVVMISDGNMNDMNYFKIYVGAHLKKDFDELYYKIGKGDIVTEQSVKAYLSSLQPAYIKYFTEFQKQRDGIISSQNKSRAPIHNNPDPLNCGSPCTNPGFEAGNGFWDYWGGNPITATDPTNLTAGFNPPPPGFFGTNPNPHLITTAGGFDPTVGGTILPVVPPGGGNNALRLGDLVAWGGSSWGASRASISFTVSASNANFTYRYAVVLHDPGSGHTDPERPYFRVKIRDAGGTVVPCGEYFVMAKTPFAGFFETAPGTDIWYRPWTSVFVPLQPYVGQCITVEFTSSDCEPGGHFGYGYIDCACDPLSIVSSSPNICGGTSVTLTAPTGGAHYSWTDSLTGGTVGIIGSDTMQTCVVSQAGTYSVVITSVAGPTCTTTLNITIGSNPSLPIAHFTNTTVCVGAPMQFTDASTPVGSITGWKWDFNHDGITDDTTQNPTHIFATTGTFPVTLIIKWGTCNAVDTQNVVVSTATLPVLTPAGPFCSNDAAVNLISSIPTGTWSGTGITNATLGTFTPSVPAIGTDTVTFTAAGACPASAKMAIIVTPIPVSDAGPDLALCSGGTGTIGAAAVTGYTYSWLPTTGITGSTTVSNPSVTLTNPGPAASLTTTYTVTTTAGGCHSTQTVDVVVHSVTTVNAGSAQYVCPGASITLAGTVGGSANNGTWSGGTGTYSPDNATLNAVYTPSAAEFAADSVILTLTTDDPAGPCTFSSSNVIFRFYSNPLVNFTVDNPNGCPPGHCVQFFDSSSVGPGSTITSMVWGFGDGSPAYIGPTPVPHCYTQTGYYDVTLTVTSNHGCVSTLTQNHLIHVYELPDAEFLPTPNPASVLDGTVTLNNQSSTDVNYWYWDFGDGNHLSPSTSSPIHDYPHDTAGHFIATLIVHNADGCYDTIAHEIFIGPSFTFFIPNAFSPNGDKINDYFFGAGTGIIKYDLWIFDRWGNTIFHGLNLTDKWDGKANSGSDMAQIDVYVWKVKLIDVFNKTHDYIGTVTLVK